MKKKIIISGFGGQGVMLAGTLLCYAGMKEDRFVTFFPSYGAEMRGGTANCQVIISEEPIGSPVVYNPDILISLNKPSYVKFSPRVNKNGFILANASLFDPVKPEGIKVIEIPASELAEKVGSGLVLNIVMIGALVSAIGLPGLESVIDSVGDVLAEKKRNLWNINKEAARTGFRYVNEIKK
jgi:2-oxoglutarate ferredoxin oxidoreductase subunit gamma